MDSRLRKAKETQAAVDTADALKALVPKVEALLAGQAVINERLDRLEGAGQKGPSSNPKGGR